MLFRICCYTSVAFNGLCAFHSNKVASLRLSESMVTISLALQDHHLLATTTTIIIMSHEPLKSRFSILVATTTQLSHVREQAHRRRRRPPPPRACMGWDGRFL